MSQRCPSFVHQVYDAYIQSPFTFMLLFEVSRSLSRSFLSFLDFACRPFLVLVLVQAHYDRFLPHYTSLLSTSCWMMGDALMPSFQWIPSHRLQMIYSRIGFQIHLSALTLTVTSGWFSCHRNFGNTSMPPDRWILPSALPQHIYSHLLDCTLVR